MSSPLSHRIPTKFRFEYGGFPSGYRVVVLQAGGLEFIPLTHQPEMESGRRLKVDDGDWARFAEQLANLGVLHWQKTYADPGVLDGTQWRLVIDWPGRGSVRSSGSNAYPDDFEQFLDAMSVLTGGQFAAGR